MGNEFTNLLEDYDKLNEQVSKAENNVNESDANQVEETKEQVAETDRVENPDSNEAVNESVENQENAMEEVAVTSQAKDTVNDPTLPETEEVEKTAKGSEEMSEGLNEDTVVEGETQLESTDVPSEESPEADEVEVAEPQEGDNTEAKDTEEKRENEVSKSLTDEDIMKGFRTVFKSLELLSNQTLDTVKKSDIAILTDSVENINNKLEVLTTDTILKSFSAKDVESADAEEEEDTSGEDESVQKSVDSVVKSTDDAEGFVSKSVTIDEEVSESTDTEASTEDSEEVDTEGYTEDYPKLFNDFMDKFKTVAGNRQRNVGKIYEAQQAYLAIRNNPGHESAHDLQIVKDFIDN